MRKRDDENNNEFLRICFFILMGVVGVSVSAYELMIDIDNGWKCYSRHGHVLESAAECQFQLFAGFSVSAAALFAGLSAARRRRKQ